VALANLSPFRRSYLGVTGVLAYLDANSGSMIAGALAAGFAGIAVAFKVWRQRLVGVFSRRGAEEAPATDET